MSYDLIFQTRGAPLDSAEVAEYFASRPNYRCEPPEFNYGNAETGVYFQFAFEDAPDEPGQCVFHMNYFRPSYFVLEAEPEVTEFVKRFDLTVVDVQLDGMGEGEYRPEKLHTGWNKGNEFGYQAILTNPEFDANVASLPSEVLQDAWRWNFARSLIQSQLGQYVFVPKVVFGRVNGKPATVSVWPDGLPIATAPVDYFIVARDELAPRRLLMRRKDHVIVPWEQVWPWIQKYRAPDEKLLVMKYDRHPDDLKKFIQELPAVAPVFEPIRPDEMLDTELVEKYRARPQ